jgi:hypothetical protein
VYRFSTTGQNMYIQYTGRTNFYYSYCIVLGKGNRRYTYTASTLAVVEYKRKYKGTGSTQMVNGHLQVQYVIYCKAEQNIFKLTKRTRTNSKATYKVEMYIRYVHDITIHNNTQTVKTK